MQRSTADHGHEDDGSGWLVTFSDLVLQLFAFVVVGTVLARHGAAPPLTVEPPHPAPTQVVRTTGPVRRPTVVEAPLVAETIPRHRSVAELVGADE